MGWSPVTASVLHVPHTCCASEGATWSAHHSARAAPTCPALLCVVLCRACVRAHKVALQAQRQFWHCLLRDNVSFRDLQLCFENMEKAERIATGVYRR